MTLVLIKRVNLGRDRCSEREDDGEGHREKLAIPRQKESLRADPPLQPVLLKPCFSMSSLQDRETFLLCRLPSLLWQR